jgi:uncharacterized protein (DUF2062 family)
MLFRRRSKPNIAARVRETVWPRGGWIRALRYFGKRILRLSDTPHAVAIGFAAGLFVAWSPLFGLHYFLAVALAFVLRGNVLASVLSTTIGNPLTVPAMWVADFKLGEHILGVHHIRRLAVQLPETLARHSIDTILPIIKPMLIGWAVLGGSTAIISYFVVRAAVQAYQQARRARLEARRHNRLAEAARA